MESPRQGVEDTNDPLGTVSPLKVSSSTDALAVIDDIEDMINNKTDWEVRCQGLKNAMMYLKGNINQFPGCDFTILSTGIADCILDSRSTLVRWATLLVSACAMQLKSGFANSSDILIQNLFKQVPNGTQYISKSCSAALKYIYTYVTHRRVARSFLTAASNKSPASRVIVVQAIECFANNWPIKIVVGLKQNIDHVLNHMVNDSCFEVRKIASRVTVPSSVSPPTSPRSPSLKNTKKIEEKPKKGILKTPNRAPSASPSKIPIKLRSSPSSPMERKKNHRVSFAKTTDEIIIDEFRDTSNKKQSNSFELQQKEENKIPETTIDELMPPTSVKITLKFLNMLDDIIQCDQIDKLDGLEELLPESIIIGSRYVADFAKWRYSLEFLIPKFSQEFKDKILEILSTFFFDSLLLEIVDEVYKINTIAKMYLEAPRSFTNDAIQFFYQCSIKFPDYVPEIQVVQYLKSISENIPQKYYENLHKLIQLGTPASNNKEPLIQYIKTLLDNELLDFESQKNLLQIYNLTPSELTDFERDLAILWEDIVAQGKNKLIDNFTKFLVSVVPKLDVMSFAGFVDPLFILISSESPLNQKKFIELLTEFVGNEETLNCILSIVDSHIKKENLESGNLNIIINSIFEYINSHSDDKTDELITVISPRITPLLKSSSTSIRRYTISIFSAFYKANYALFEPYFKSLAPAQQRLIVMYAKK
ncbi:hypothetical protein TVAG_236140 [Trichomonas vaginalis G3]|uniref:CLASP N-terminal domain-containing protein n=1 Tax=Trichomonas vaginalis (strain ATCC PRA-98 / G3) TaxID=412133 RepID=A2F7K9_TRIV3|nr:microtubule binding CLASP family [Trichomonas vaginalis G3]EAX99116.1 hypothetical protein TVAG_236140 [Trichomonas vaginalis G3]KAI5513558.1 microtubule binding CLASP family [Trichomonas vaginalis G3]|eukprot:XP_001312046.1 hypothetical protein [Trichomonas vaginalis G3]